MVLGEADGVLTATVLHANRLASVGGAVARFRSGTVGIGQTLHLAAALPVRVAGVQSGCRTGAFGGVVAGHADRSGSAPHRRTDGDTAANAVAIRFAGFRFGTLSVRLTVVLGYLSTSIAVIGVTGESGAADALADMVGCAAVGIGRASVSGANWCTFADSQHIRSAYGVGFTIRIRKAIGYWF